ncbi:MAG: hypothetical protein D6785_00910 [Planctomycetota bacterium]|nr:MAG: hypothetical protein D6785_00910 [Planctomycetota bacterium]
MSQMIDKLMGWAWSTPEKIARTIGKVIASPNPPLRVPATLDACFFSHLRRYLPRRLHHWILYQNLPSIHKWGK